MGQERDAILYLFPRLPEDVVKSFSNRWVVKAILLQILHGIVEGLLTHRAFDEDRLLAVLFEIKSIKISTQVELLESGFRQGIQAPILDLVHLIDYLRDPEIIAKLSSIYIAAIRGPEEFGDVLLEQFNQALLRLESYLTDPNNYNEARWLGYEIGKEFGDEFLDATDSPKDLILLTGNMLGQLTLDIAIGLLFDAIVEGINALRRSGKMGRLAARVLKRILDSENSSIISRGIKNNGLKRSYLNGRRSIIGHKKRDIQPNKQRRTRIPRSKSDDLDREIIGRDDEFISNKSRGLLNRGLSTEPDPDLDLSITRQKAEIDKQYKDRTKFMSRWGIYRFLELMEYVNGDAIIMAVTKARLRQGPSKYIRRLNEIQNEVWRIWKSYPSKIRSDVVRRKVAVLIEEATDLARKRFDSSTRGLTWSELYKDKKFRELSHEADLTLPPCAGQNDCKKAPLVWAIRAKDGKLIQVPMHINHKTPLSHNPFRGQDPYNLEMMTPSENSVFLEALRKNSRQPFTDDLFERWLLQNGLSPEERKELIGL